jgi:hypothetical protein
MLKRLLHAQVPFPKLTLGRVMATFSILGAVGLAHMFGAAIMFFQLPTSVFWDRAFGGAKAWIQRGESTLPFLSPEQAAEQAHKSGIMVDQAEKTCDGFTLIAMTTGSKANLIDMRGTVVHHWELPFSKAFPHATHIDNPLEDAKITWFRCHLYPNGDLLALYHADGDTPYGYGLVKVDKDSKLLWAYANHCHHDLDVGEDGTIYTLAHQIVSEAPAGLEFIEAPYLTDSLIVLSPEGEVLQNIPLLEAFANSPYALTLKAPKRPTSPFAYGPKVTPIDNSSTQQGMTVTNPLPKNDVLHTNAVKVLNPALASKFPLFQAGQVLLSVRHTNTIAVLDLKTHSVVWAAQGIWRAQHDAAFLDNGHLLLYDNAGTPKQTRVLEYEPRTQAFPWAYGNEDSTPFSATFRGMAQRLSNGNTLITDPDERRIFEVTLDKKRVWEFICPLPSTPQGQRPRAHAVNSARRYQAKDLDFLKSEARPRP